MGATKPERILRGIEELTNDHPSSLVDAARELLGIVAWRAVPASIASDTWELKRLWMGHPGLTDSLRINWGTSGY